MTKSYYIVDKCINCGFKTDDQTFYNEDGLCRNCEEGKFDAKRGHS